VQTLSLPSQAGGPTWIQYLVAPLLRAKETRSRRLPAQNSQAAAPVFSVPISSLRALRDSRMSMMKATSAAMSESRQLMKSRLGGSTYGRFYRSKCVYVLRYLNEQLVAWACRKYKRFRRRERAAAHWLGGIAKRDLHLLVLWELGVTPAAGTGGAG
jgi:hypothetical protein